jgi:Domain of unknown function (DUF4383)
MSRTLCRVLGVVFVLAGVAGFADPNLLGLHLTPAHNIIHILSGLVTLYVGFAGSTDAVRGLGLAFGSAYALLGLLGFVAPDLVGGLLGHSLPLDATALAPDNLLHVLLGAAFLFVGLAVPSTRGASPITRLNL